MEKMKLILEALKKSIFSLVQTLKTLTFGLPRESGSDIERLLKNPENARKLEETLDELRREKKNSKTIEISDKQLEVTIY